jgi:hypothetical protein
MVWSLSADACPSVFAASLPGNQFLTAAPGSRVRKRVYLFHDWCVVILAYFHQVWLLPCVHLSHVATRDQRHLHKATRLIILSFAPTDRGSRRPRHISIKYGSSHVSKANSFDIGAA